MGAHQEKPLSEPRLDEKPLPKKSSEKKKKRRSPQKIIAIVLASLAGLLVIAAVVAWGFLKYTSQLRDGMFNDRTSSEMQAILDQRQKANEQKEADGQQEAPEGKTLNPLDGADWIDADGTAYRYRDDVLTILVMGIDNMNKPENWAPGIVSNGGNADVLALITLDTANKSFSILYIPRDTMTDLLMLDPEGNYLDTVFNNISASHSYGDGGHLSCELTAEAVSNLLCGFPIQRYASINMESLPVVNRLLGGLEVTFPDDYTKLDSSFRQGVTVHLTDQQLNRLIRYRDKSELEGANQRGLRDLKLVLNAMLRQVKSMIRSNLTSALSLYTELEPYLTTNLTLDEVSYLAQQMNRIRIDDSTVISIPGETKAGEKYVEFYPDLEWLRQYVIDNYCIKLN